MTLPTGAGLGCAGAVLIVLISTMASTRADVCPAEEIPPTRSTKDQTPVKRLLLKPKNCPDFKDDADQSFCCPSRITYGTYYCCTVEQLHEIEAEIAAEKRREFVKQYLAIIVVCTIGIAIISLIILSMVCRKYSCCPFHEGKDVYSQSGSFPISASHSGIGSRYYRPVEQIPPMTARSGQSISNSLAYNLSTPTQQKPHMTQWVEAPPPYDSIRQMCTTVTPPGAQRQHDFNCILENQLNLQRDRDD